MNVNCAWLQSCFKCDEASTLFIGLAKTVYINRI